MTTQRKRTAHKGDGPALNYILANEKTAVNLKSRKDIYREHAMTAETVPGCREVEA